MNDPPEISALTVRRRFKTAEADASRLRLLEGIATVVGDETQRKAALTNALVQVLRYLAAESGVVLLQESGALTVQAAHGAVLPVGAQIPVGGVYAETLRPPRLILLRESVVSRLPVGRSTEVAMELLVPLRFGGQSLGILAVLSSSSVLPTEEDLQTLNAVAVLLGAAVTTQSANKPRAVRKEAHASLAQLTPREQQVLALLPRGLSNAQIAAQLGIATGTAKIHIEHILHKLGLKHRTQAAVRAAEWGHRP